MSSIQHDSVREGARRLHRQIAVFGVLYCWKNKLDAMFISKQDFQKIIGITRVEESRLKWMFEDVHDYFPYAGQVDRGGLTYYVVSRRPSEELKKSKRVDVMPMWESLAEDDMDFSLDSNLRDPSIKYLKEIVPFLFDDTNQTAHMLSILLASIAAGDVAFNKVCKD